MPIRTINILLDFVNVNPLYMKSGAFKTSDILHYRMETFSLINHIFNMLPPVDPKDHGI